MPLRIGIGPRDLENGTIELARRDNLSKQSLKQTEIAEKIPVLLDEIQQSLFTKAKEFRAQNTHNVNSYEEFKDTLNKKGGFIYAHWDGTKETEIKIKEETKATIRLIPISNDEQEGNCIFSNKPSKQKVVFAKAY